MSNKFTKLGAGGYPVANVTTGAAPPEDITGNLTQTEASDSLTAAAKVTVSGILTAIEASDIIVAAANVRITAALSKTEASDTISGLGRTIITGSLSETEDDDTLLASAGEVIVGNLSELEDNDMLSASGVIGEALPKIETIIAAAAIHTKTGVTVRQKTAQVTSAGHVEVSVTVKAPKQS